MTKVQQLKEELAKAEAKEKDDSAKSDLEKAMSEKDKCYATSLFHKYFKGMVQGTLRRVTDVRLNERKEVEYQVQNIEFQYNKNGEFRANFNTHSVSSVRNWYESFRYEITLEQFLSVKNSLSIGIQSITADVRKQMKDPDLYYTQGEHTEDEGRMKILKKLGTPLVVLPTKSTNESNISVREILDWQHHPFIINGTHIINSNESKVAIEYIIHEMNKDALRWGGSILSRDYPRIELLRKFVAETKWNE